MRTCYELAEPGLPYVRRRVQHARDRLKGMKPFMPPEPTNKRGTDQHFHIGPRFVEQCRRLQSALPGSDDYDPFLGKTAQITVVARMGGQFARHVLEFLGLAGKGLNPCCDNHAARLPDFAVFYRKLKPVSVFLDWR